MTGYVFAAVFFALLILSVARHPRYGMFAYMAAFYVFPPSRWWGATLPDFRWSLLASAFLWLGLLRYPRNPDQPPWSQSTPGRLLIAFSILVWMQNLWALAAPENLDFSILYTKYVLLFYFMYRLSDRPENIRDILIAHVVGCLYLGWIAYGTPVDSDRLDGVGGPGINDSNTLGMQFATAIPCGAMLALVERGWVLILTLVSLLFSMNGIVLCGSRGAFLSVVAGGGSLAFSSPKRYRAAYLAASVLGLVMFSAVASATFWNRMDTLKGAVDDNAAPLDNSAESRYYIVEAQWQMFLQHPLGTGHRGTAALSRQFIAERYLSRTRDGGYGERASHNSFMSALSEHGIVGAAIFIWLIFWAWGASRECRKILQQSSPVVGAYVAAVSGALVVILIAGLFADFIAVEVTIWMLAILASVQAIARRNPASLVVTPAPKAARVTDARLSP